MDKKREKPKCPRCSHRGMTDIGINGFVVCIGCSFTIQVVTKPTKERG